MAELTTPNGTHTARTLVVGLGNPVLGDDGVGWRVVDRVEAWLGDEAAAGRPRDAEVERLALGGLRLMERLVGYETAILVDAARFVGDRNGDVMTLPLSEVPAGRSGHLDSAHDASLPTALRLGRQLGAELPGRIMVVAIRAERVEEFSDELSAEVEAAIPVAARAVIELLDA